MNRMVSFIFIWMHLLACSSFSQENRFKKFEDKFVLKKVPIELPGVCGIRASNAPSNITFDEYSKLLKIEKNTWKYEKDYYYNTGLRFKINEIYSGFIYFRSYLPVDMLKEVGESILVVFDKNWNIISSLSIQGNKGDDLSYSGRISKDLDIKILTEELSLDKSGNSIIRNTEECYRIRSDGSIEQMIDE